MIIRNGYTTDKNPEKSGSLIAHFFTLSGFVRRGGRSGLIVVTTNPYSVMMSDCPMPWNPPAMMMPTNIDY